MRSFPVAKTVVPRRDRRAGRVTVLATVVALAAGLVAACGGGGKAAPPPARAWPGVVTASHAAVPDNPAAPADDAIYTQRGSDSRVGWNYHETTLTTRNVNAKDFGRLAALPVQGKIYASPLFVPGLRIGGGVHNVVFVATEDDQVYAFDADTTGTAPALFWHASFLTHGATPVNVKKDLPGCTFIQPTLGITGTPVIDQATGRMYLVTVMIENGRLVDEMHALSITTGHDAVPPVVITASVHGTGLGSSHGVLMFAPAIANQHAGLLLSQGVVYAAFSAYCDRPPDHGWILGYSASDLHRSVVYNDSPNGVNGGIWQSATALVADPQGHIYAETGDGSFDLNTGGKDASDSVLELQRTGSTLKVVDYFTPFYQYCMEQHDGDLSSGAPLLLPKEIITIAKAGAFYVLDRSHLGGYHAVNVPSRTLCETVQYGPGLDASHVIQETTQNTVNGGVWSAETAWTHGSGTSVYVAGETSYLEAWPLSHGKIAARPSSRAPELMNYPGAIPMGSSDGGDPASAIVWAFQQDHPAGPPILRAYQATDLSHELWNSQQGAAGSAIPSYDNFTLPTVADGRVYLGTSGELLVYGLLHH